MELPVLTRKVPEGKTLSLYLVIVLESANVAALAYLVARRFAKNRLSEIPVIYSCFGLGAISLALTGCFWSHTTLILGQPSSFALLLSGFLAAIVSCVSVVTYIPFTARLRQPYITAVFLGDALGSLVPHLLTVAQGITTNTRCWSRQTDQHARSYTRSPPSSSQQQQQQHIFSNISSPSFDEAAAALDDERGRLGAYVVESAQSTTPAGLRHLELRFSEYGYFLVCGALLVLSAVSFVLLRWCRLCRFEYAESFIDQMDDVEMSQGGRVVVDDNDVDDDHDDNDDDIWQTSCDGLRTENASAERKSPKPKDRPDYVTSPYKTPNSPTVTVTSTTRINSERSASPSSLARGRAAQCRRAARLASSASECTGSVVASETTPRPMSFPLLIAITFWTTAILSGPLSTDKTYACFPIENTPFVVGTILCDVAVIVTCVVAARTAVRQQVTIVIALCCLGTILLTYFVALIAFSHESESRDQSPLYGKAGEMLTVSVISLKSSYRYFNFRGCCGDQI